MPPNAKKGKAPALKAWSKLPADQREPGPVVLFLDFLRETQAEVYVKDGGQFLPHGAAFVNARLWEDDRDAFPPAARNGSHGRASIEAAPMPNAVESYLMLRGAIDFSRALPEEDRDNDADDLANMEIAAREKLEEINRDPAAKKALRAAMEESDG